MIDILQPVLDAILPDVVLLVLVIGTWIAISALYVPGSGVLEGGAVAVLAVGAALALLTDAQIVGLILFGLTILLFMAQVLLKRALWLVVLGFGGQVLASTLLYPADDWPSVWALLLLNLAGLVYHQVIIQPGLSIQTQRSMLGDDSLAGEVAQLTRRADPVGTVHLHGETWQVLAAAPLGEGAWVRVTGRDGLRLRVEPLDGPPSFEPGSGRSPFFSLNRRDLFGLLLLALGMIVLVILGSINLTVMLVAAGVLLVVGVALSVLAGRDTLPAAD